MSFASGEELILSPIVGKECAITTPPETEPTV